ncbi:MAG: histidine phosphatase family protein [Bacteroidales bacterium]|nr:histidine phosphatase family protein [Bacteroidales bacterium]
MKINYLNNNFNFSFIRHGQTSWNKEERLNSTTDISITEDGRNQILASIEYLKKLNFSRIISSPMIRTLETAEIIKSYLNIPLYTDKRLVEVNFGEFEGKTAEELLADKSFRNIYLEWIDDTNPKFPPQCETYENSANRIIHALLDLSSLNGRTLIVTHGAIIRILISVLFLKVPASYFRRLVIDNGSISSVGFLPNISDLYIECINHLE